jgi:regulator of sigma E protease
MTLVVFVLVLSVLVLVHELGHFVAARIFGIRVEEFAFGLPFTPPIFKIKHKGTPYAIYPLLFGGFVRLYGEDKQEKEKEAYWGRSVKQRVAVLLAGVTMNVILALLGFVALYGVVGVPVRQVQKVTLVKVESDSPAAKAGLVAGDRVVEVEGKTFTSSSDFSKLVDSWKGIGVNLTVQRGKGVQLFEGIAEQNISQTVVNVVPREKPPEGQGALGIVYSEYTYLETGQCNKMSPVCWVKAAKQGVVTPGLWMGLRDVGKSLLAGRAPEGVGGPVVIYQLTGIVAAEGVWPLVELVAILSVNLAIFNVLPIPALDGGRLFFVIIEGVFKKRISSDLEQKINSWGMAFLIGLMVLISFQDILRLFWPVR